METLKLRAFDEDRNEMIYAFQEKVHPTPCLLQNEEQEIFVGSYQKNGDWQEPTLMRYSGLKDKNDVEIYLDSDIIEVKNFEYSEPSGFGEGFYTRKTDLRFILHFHPLKTKYTIINPPKGLKSISLDVIFNLPLPSGKRMFVDYNRQNVEVIGNTFQNPELLNQQ